jgi:hypothetical protein
MHSVVRSLLAPALCAVLLAACGGGISLSFGDGDDDFGELDPYPSGRSATLTVSDASHPPLDGTYSSANVMLGDVLRFFATSRDPETCRFRFDDLRQSPGVARMEGEIRYLPGTSTLRTTFLFIDGAEYRLDGSAGASVDRDAGRVRYTGAVLQARDSLQQLTLDGTVPMRGARPSGC